MLQSRLIGAGVEQSAFVLAFAIPNMARKLFMLAVMLPASVVTFFCALVGCVLFLRAPGFRLLFKRT